MPTQFVQGLMLNPDEDSRDLLMLAGLTLSLPS